MGTVLSVDGAVGFFQLSGTRSCQLRVLHTTASTFVRTNEGGRCKKSQVYLLHLNAILATRLQPAGASSLLLANVSARKVLFRTERRGGG
jgi:hypothetical protein